jgi:hypothetical protein
MAVPCFVDWNSSKEQLEVLVAVVDTNDTVMSILDLALL